MQRAGRQDEDGVWELVPRQQLLQRHRVRLIHVGRRGAAMHAHERRRAAKQGGRALVEVGWVGWGDGVGLGRGKATTMPTRVSTRCHPQLHPCRQQVVTTAAAAAVGAAAVGGQKIRRRCCWRPCHCHRNGVPPRHFRHAPPCIPGGSSRDDGGCVVGLAGASGEGREESGSRQRHGRGERMTLDSDDNNDQLQLLPSFHSTVAAPAPSPLPPLRPWRRLICVSMCVNRPSTPPLSYSPPTLSSLYSSSLLPTPNHLLRLLTVSRAANASARDTKASTSTTTLSAIAVVAAGWTTRTEIGAARRQGAARGGKR